MMSKFARDRERDSGCQAADDEYDGPGSIRLMTRDTFQENQEATGKLQRAQLSSCQLPMYFIAGGAG